MVDCELCKFLTPILAFVIGYHVVLPLLGILLRHLLLTRLWSKRGQLKKLGGWAVVTGSTDGIGKAYAQALAKEGLNVVLIARSPEKLADVAKELRADHSVEVRTLVADFSRADIYEKLEAELADIDVACLVNNVGMSYAFPTYVAGGPKPIDAADLQPMLNVNCVSMLRLTRMLLPRMLPRGGAVINVASGSGLYPVPFLAAYAGTKAFAVNFSQSVAVEVRHLASKGGAVAGGVTIQTVAPYVLATKMSRVRRANFFMPGPASFVNEALNLLGVEDLTVGCLSHALQHWFVCLLPTCVANYLTCSIMHKTMVSALKRQAKAN